MHQRTLYLSVILILLISAAVACRDDTLPTQVPTVAPPVLSSTEQPPGGDQQPAPGSPAVPTETAIPPSPTPSEPLAATVNGRPVYLADYEKELARYEQAQVDLGLTPGEGNVNYRKVVLDALIETELIAQAAEANGIVVTPEMVTQRLAELEEASGGAENFNAWLEANQWTVDEFRQALAAEMVTEKTVEFITADVPTAVEQVRARYIQVDDPTLATSLLEQIRNGADFPALAQQFSLDRVTGESGGDLGFFARGSLLVIEVETAAFALQPGETSEIITAPRADGSGTSYYLVQVIERDPQRTLAPEQRFELLQEKFEAWLADLWNQAEITLFVDTG